jgi:hypothetical protein
VQRRARREPPRQSRGRHRLRRSRQRARAVVRARSRRNRGPDHDCTHEASRPPTFIGVDFYEVGDLLAVTRRYDSIP